MIGLARRLPALVVPSVEWRRGRHELRPRGRVCGRRCRCAPRVGDPALARCGRPARRQRRWVDARAGRRCEGRRLHPRVRLQRRRVLPGPKDGEVDELAHEGIESSFYSRHKAEVESLLDEFERGEPGVRVVHAPRLDPQASCGDRDPAPLPGPLRSSDRLRAPRPRRDAGPRCPALPGGPTDDVADAVRRALIAPDARGPSISPRTRCWTRTSCPRCSPLAGSGSHPASCAVWQPERGGPACSRRRRAGWTWR